MNDATKAVFLSYAREDADSARRIADALRAFGVEVWLDQSELRGGDTWDQKIKKQIRECALFLPLVSAHTQARTEGYFRRERLLAVERTRDMAGSKAFIVPVVIDETREAEAAVPEEFMRYQWTRLAHGVPTPQFVEQVKRLLEAPRKGASVSRSGTASRSASDSGAEAAPLPVGRRVPAAAWAAAIAVLVAALGFVWWWQAKSTPNAGAGTRPPTAEKTAALSPVRQLVAKATALHDQLEDVTRGDLDLAEQFCKQAIALEPNDGEAWAAYALVSCNFIALAYDNGDERRAAARLQADRAVKLAPDSNEARFALAYSYRWQSSTVPEAVRLLRELVGRMPADKRVLRALGNVLRGTQGRNEEALVYYDRAAALPGGDPLALFQRALALSAAGRDAEAEASVEESLAMHPSGNVYVRKVALLMDRGDLEQARAALEKVPGPYLLEDLGATAASRLWLWRHEPEKCLEVLRAVPRDFFESGSIGFIAGPKGMLSGRAHHMAGRTVAAAADWRAALQVIAQRPAVQRNSADLLFRKAQLLAYLSERDEAERVLREFQEQLAGGKADYRVALVNAQLNKPEAALEILESQKMPRAILSIVRFDPDFDPLRSNARFQALLRQAEAGAPAPAAKPASGPKK